MSTTFQVTDKKQLYDIVDSNPLGLIAAIDERSAFVFAYTPLLLTRSDGEHGLLRAHLAISNPIVPCLSRRRECAVIFWGPNAYVSPCWYEAPSEHAPTWNYVAVEARCSVASFHGQADLSAQLRDMSRQFESPSSGWSYEGMPVSLKQKLETEIVGFSLRIDALIGRFKLSQNRSRSDRARVIDRLSKESSPDSQELAKTMLWFYGE
jgi:transcriptional regulator